MLLNFCEIGGGGCKLELNFLGFQIKENFWEAKFLGICLKLSLAKKIFPQNHRRLQKFKKMTKYSFFCKFFTRYE